MATLKHELENAAFLADVGHHDRNIGRLILTVVTGAVGSLLAVTMVIVVVAVGYMIYLIGAGGDPNALVALMEPLQDPEHALTYGEIIAVLVFIGIANSMLFLGFVLIACLFNKRRFRSYVTAAPRFRWRLMLTGVGLFVAVLGPLLALGAWLDPNMPTYPMFRLTSSTDQRVTYAVVAVICLFPAAFAEEVLFRGWLMKQVAAFTRRTWVLLLINGVLFSLMHYPDIGPTAFLARAIMGAGFCYMVLRLGGVEFATGAHAANNILLLLFVQPLTIVPEPGQPFVPLMAVGALAEATGYVVITEIVLRWKALRDWTGAAVASSPATDPAEVFS